VARGVIVSGQSLVLQKVARSDSGVYTCTAHNTEGDGESNPLTLDIRCREQTISITSHNGLFSSTDKPFCKPGQVQVYGVAKREKVRVSCDVLANPSVDLDFEWVFNSSSERLDLQENLVEVKGTRSLAHHMPQTELDYGSLMCWARNSIGRQEEPCVFHLIPAGVPDSVADCGVRNQTYSTLYVSCSKGFDGGLPQAFVLEVSDAKTGFAVANTTNARSPTFAVTGLRPGTGYVVSVHSYNAKGSSTPSRIHAFTAMMEEGAGLKAGPPKEPKTGESALTKMGEFRITPVLAGLLTVGAALLLVFVIISLYFCVARKPRGAPPSGGRRSKPTTPRGTHVPLQTGVDDCVNGATDIEQRASLLDHLGGVGDDGRGGPDLIPVRERGEEDPHSH